MKAQPRMAAALGAALVALAACSDVGPTAADAEPARPAAPAQTVLGRPAADLDLSLYIKPTAAGGGILIYHIQNGFVYEGAASDGRLLLQYNETDLRLASGAARCLFRDSELVDAATGPSSSAIARTACTTAVACASTRSGSTV